MKKEVKIALFIGLGLLTAGIITGKVKFSSKEKKSQFVDEELSEAEGMTLPAGAAKKSYRPNSWAKVGNNWIWVNADGNLVLTDGV